MSDKDVDKIDAVNFDHNNNSVFLNQAATKQVEKPAPWIWFGLGGLLLLALLVIFVLPSIVTEYELPLERRVDLADTPVAEAVANTANAISPFQEAQRALQRKEAQDVLAELLTYQAELDVLDVAVWGQQAYEASLEQASIGDEYYRAQDFVLARESYEAGREGLRSLIDSVPSILDQTLAEAEQAVIELDSAEALTKFTLALLLDPENQLAQIGEQRALTLDDVSALLKEADDLVEDGGLQQALANYRAVLDLDSYNETAGEKIAAVSLLITENEFAQIMSSGYALLQAGEPEQAVAAFQRASRLGIKQDEAQAAINQTENEIANTEINRLSGLVKTAQQNEQWQDAVDQYDNVLAIDSNLLFAINGRDYADKRARLDRLLVEAVDNPERFSEDEVFEETRLSYFIGRDIENPGPRLAEQLDELEAFLEYSLVPIVISFSSDNQTEVTLLRIEELGVFEQTSLSLKPGRYVVIGKRSGYREVREEFTVGFGLTPETVIVQCDERIASSSRR
jgi:tetratricopeptide (TPR) repeat protein